MEDIYIEVEGLEEPSTNITTDVDYLEALLTQGLNTLGLSNESITETIVDTINTINIEENSIEEIEELEILTDLYESLTLEERANILKSKLEELYTEALVEIKPSHYDERYFEIQILYPEFVIVSNTNYKVQHTIKNMLVKLDVEFYYNGNLIFKNFNGTRLELSLSEFKSNYFHSHLPTCNKLGYFKSFCLGSTIFGSYGLSSSILLNFDNEDYSIDDYKFDLDVFFLCINNYLKTESTNTNPFITISNINSKETEVKVTDFSTNPSLVSHDVNGNYNQLFEYVRNNCKLFYNGYEFEVLNFEELLLNAPKEYIDKMYYYKNNMVYSGNNTNNMILNKPKLTEAVFKDKPLYGIVTNNEPTGDLHYVVNPYVLTTIINYFIFLLTKNAK